MSKFDPYNSQLETIQWFLGRLEKAHRLGSLALGGAVDLMGPETQRAHRCPPGREVHHLMGHPSVLQSVAVNSGENGDFPMVKQYYSRTAVGKLTKRWKITFFNTFHRAMFNSCVSLPGGNMSRKTVIQHDASTFQ